VAETLEVRDVLGGVAATLTGEPISETADAEAKTERVQAYLALALRRFETAKNAENDFRKAAEDDQEFSAGTSENGDSTQWDDGIQASRKADGRPCLTINREPAFIHQVTNAARAARPAIQVIPRDSKSDPDTAEVIWGLIRQIEQASNADVAYNTAVDHQARVGRGWVRVVADYANDTSFDVDLRIRRVPNTFSVFRDPGAQEFDYADMRFAFVVDDLPNDEYEARYGRKPPSQADFDILGNASAGLDWAPEGHTKVAEYWHVDYIDDEAFLLDDGSTWLQSQGDRPPGDARQVVRRRQVRRRQVKVSIINGADILEGNDAGDDGRAWPGSRIPIVPVIGEELNIKGKTDYRGVVRDSKDAQRMYNYWVTSLTEKIALEPKSPFVADFRSISAYKAIWDTANKVNYSVLPYDSTDPDDPQKTYPAPSRQFSDPAGIQAMTMAIRQADNDLKATTGFYDASLGNAGPEQSGKAIFERKQQGTLGSSHYPGNLAVAVRSIGQILVDLIPYYYDVSRVVRILGLDDKPKTVLVYSGEKNRPETPEAHAALGIDPTSEGATKTARLYDLGVGRYDVTISAGPTYQNQAEQDNEILGKLIQADPSLAPLSADIIVENTHFRGKERLAKRIRERSPGLADDETGAAPLPPEVQAQLQQQQQQIAQMGQALQEAESGLAAKKLDTDSRERIAQAEIESRERIAAMVAQSGMAEIQAKASADAHLIAIKADLARLSQFIGLDADAAKTRATQAHDAGKTRAQLDAQARRDRATAQPTTEPRAPTRPAQEQT